MMSVERLKQLLRDWSRTSNIPKGQDTAGFYPIRA